MASSNQEGEAPNGRLQLFFSSILASLGGVFGQNNQQEAEEEQEEKDLEMALRAVVLEQQGKGKNHFFIYFSEKDYAFFDFHV